MRIVREGLAVFMAALMMAVPVEATTPNPALSQELSKSYAQVMADSTAMSFSPADIAAMKTSFEAARKKAENAAKKKLKADKKEISTLEEKLRKVPDSDTADRDALHCQIQALQQDQKDEIKAALDAKIEEQNNVAKLDLLQNWPQDLAIVEAGIKAGTYKAEEFGNPEDIGFRKGFGGQEKDIPVGRRALEEMHRAKEIPPEINIDAQQRWTNEQNRYEKLLASCKAKPEADCTSREASEYAAFQTTQQEMMVAQNVVDYVRNLTQKMVENSDVKVPVQVFVIEDKNANAFALPGGYLFINTGLLESTENESQLAGVIGHELAHVAARHGHKLMTQVSLYSLIFQGAIMALTIFFPPATYGMYYLYNYGADLAELALMLKLLGVSRKFEAQADVLGEQYAWHAGYDPEGFTDFFEVMAKKYGNPEANVFFEDHPAFYERIKASYGERLYLQTLPSRMSTVNEGKFNAMKADMKQFEDLKTQYETQKKEAMPSMTGNKAPVGCDAKAKPEPKEGK